MNIQINHYISKWFIWQFYTSLVLSWCQSIGGLLPNICTKPLTVILGDKTLESQISSQILRCGISVASISLQHSKGTFPWWNMSFVELDRTCSLEPSERKKANIIGRAMLFSNKNVFFGLVQGYCQRHKLFSGPLRTLTCE